jgi:hypothetical protein
MFTKHRDERDLYRISFADELAAGEAITDHTATVLDVLGNDVAADFVESTTVAGPVIEVWLKAAVDAEQPMGRYLVYCRVTTQTGRVLVAQDSLGELPRLFVYGSAATV